MKIIRTRLGSLGAVYLNARLQGGGSISKSILEITGAVKNAYSPLPDDLSSKDALKFEQGGATTQKATVQWLTSDLKYRFPSKSEFCMLIEDSWARPADLSSYHNNADYQSIIYNNSVIHVVRGENTDEAGLNRALRFTRSFEYTCLVCALPDPRFLETSVSSNQDKIVNFVKQSKLVMVSAFDREGLIISDVVS